MRAGQWSRLFSGFQADLPVYRLSLRAVGDCAVRAMLRLRHSLG
jgi:hypothetical protein